MPPPARILVHASRFPDRAAEDVRASLQSRRLRHALHYESRAQARRWLALHDAYSPARTDPRCRAVYDQAFEAVAARHGTGPIHLIGLGCGGGQKDVRLLQRLEAAGRTVFYTPVDFSLPLVLTARQAAAEVAGLRGTERGVDGIVCDVAEADDLDAWLEDCRPEGAIRVITFLGMIPNFEPRAVLPRLAGWVRPGDLCLLGANLAAGPDYESGVRRVLPQYANALTDEWLLTLPRDLGLESGAGTVEWKIECEPPDTGLLRIAAWLRFERYQTLHAAGEVFHFEAGEALRLFFSYRYTPELLGRLLVEEGLRVEDTFLTDSCEEGVLLLSKA